MFGPNTARHPSSTSSPYASMTSLGRPLRQALDLLVDDLDRSIDDAVAEAALEDQLERLREIEALVLRELRRQDEVHQVAELDRVGITFVGQMWPAWWCSAPRSASPRTTSRHEPDVIVDELTQATLHEVFPHRAPTRRRGSQLKVSGCTEYTEPWTLAVRAIGPASMSMSRPASVEDLLQRERCPSSRASAAQTEASPAERAVRPRRGGRRGGRGRRVTLVVVAEPLSSSMIEPSGRAGPWSSTRATYRPWAGDGASSRRTSSIAEGTNAGSRPQPALIGVLGEHLHRRSR